MLALHTELPAWVYLSQHGRPTGADAGPLVWSGTKEPPKIGEQVTIGVNGIGPATVTGYASESGYLGVMAKPLNPPAWHSGGPSLTFGTEILEQRP